MYSPDHHRSYGHRYSSNKPGYGNYYGSDVTGSLQQVMTGSRRDHWTDRGSSAVCRPDEATSRSRAKEDIVHKRYQASNLGREEQKKTREERYQ